MSPQRSFHPFFTTMMTLNQQIGTKIRRARLEIGLTQKELGSQLKRSGAAIAYLEQGKRKISPDLLVEVSRITRKSMAYFYEEGSEPHAQLDDKMNRLKTLLEDIREVIERAEGLRGSCRAQT